MVRKGNLAVFESSNISETGVAGVATPTKIDVHAFDINAYLHEFFEPLNFLMTMDYSPWSERETWQFLEVAISPKPKRAHPLKLACMHLTSTFTCMSFLSRFRSIKIFDDHGRSPWSEREI